VWDDWRHTTPAVVTVAFDRDDGVWALVQLVLAAVSDGTLPDGLSDQTLHLLEQAFRRRWNESANRPHNG
jgi:hypothetical protein